MIISNIILQVLFTHEWITEVDLFEHILRPISQIINYALYVIFLYVKR